MQLTNKPLSRLPANTYSVFNIRKPGKINSLKARKDLKIFNSKQMSVLRNKHNNCIRL